ncbi:hypothetical protein DFH09DRAFT_1141512 [Mycena vulgaris]|nr:hypothetical protein DFH09DRAFT_1141512 [Mycena vulgaris]
MSLSAVYVGSLTTSYSNPTAYTFVNDCLHPSQLAPRKNKPRLLHRLLWLPRKAECHAAPFNLIKLDPKLTTTSRDLPCTPVARNTSLKLTQAINLPQVYCSLNARPQVLNYQLSNLRHTTTYVQVHCLFSLSFQSFGVAQQYPNFFRSIPSVR